MEKLQQVCKEAYDAGMRKFIEEGFCNLDMSKTKQRLVAALEEVVADNGADRERTALVPVEENDDFDEFGTREDFNGPYDEASSEQFFRRQAPPVNVAMDSNLQISGHNNIINLSNVSDILLFFCN